MSKYRVRLREVFVLFLVFNFGVALAGNVNSPIAHWSFDETEGVTAYDSAGTNDGALINGVARATGKIGGALSFDGVNDHVTVPYNSVFQLPVLTMTAWICPSTDLSISGGWVIGRGEDFVTDLAGFGMGVRPISGGRGVGVGYETDSGSDVVYNTNFYPQVGEWTHIATSRNSDGQVNIYANGNLIGQFNSSPIPTSMCYQDITIGAYLLSNGSPSFLYSFSGLIDDVRIYDYALSESEVALLVPEPTTLLILGIGAIALRRRK